MRKKMIIAGVVALASMLVLTACGGEKYGDVSAYEICRAVDDSQADFADGEPEEYGKAEDYFFDETFLYEDFTDIVSDCFYLGGHGANADEVTVAVVNDNDNRKNVKMIFEERIEERIKVFSGYAPEEVKKLEKAQVLIFGKYVICLVCGDMKAGRKAVEEAVSPGYKAKYGTADSGKNKAAKPKNDERQYATEYPEGYNPKLVEAYRTKNRNLLTDEQDLALYDRCAEILQETVAGKEMTLLDIEKALYSYIATSVEYDYGHYRWYGEAVNSANAFGALIRGKAICTGYSASFRLLCEMCGIPCISVLGSATPNGYDEPHGWNMVKLGPCWYYVDVCWATGFKPNWNYFNVTADYMRETEHFWDETGCPAADGVDYETRRTLGFEPGDEPFDDPEKIAVWVP